MILKEFKLSSDLGVGYLSNIASVKGNIFLKKLKSKVSLEVLFLLKMSHFLVDNIFQSVVNNNTVILGENLI